MFSIFSLTITTNNNDTISRSNLNSTAIVSRSSQCCISTLDVTKAGDRRKSHIISAINQWIEKNKKKFSDDYFKFIPGTAYKISIIVNPDAAIIRRAYGIKSTLKLVNQDYRVNVPSSELMILS